VLRWEARRQLLVQVRAVAEVSRGLQQRSDAELRGTVGSTLLTENVPEPVRLEQEAIEGLVGNFATLNEQRLLAVQCAECWHSQRRLMADLMPTSLPAQTGRRWCWSCTAAGSVRRPTSWRVAVFQRRWGRVRRVCCNSTAGGADVVDRMLERQFAKSSRVEAAPTGGVRRFPSLQGRNGYARGQGEEPGDA
jgi:hypothetical protein